MHYRLNSVNKKIFYILSGIFFVLLGFIALTEKSTIKKTFENKTIQVKENKVTINKTPDNTKNDILKVAPRFNMAYQQLQEKYHDDVIGWEKENFGYYYSEFVESDYSSYDITMLIVMGKSNNIRALDMLGYKYEENKNYKQALKTYYKASFLGSTAALQKIARLTENKVNTRENIVHRLSFSQAAYLRGDQKVISFAGVRVKLLENPLSEQEKKQVQENGIEIFTHLVNERKKMGLSVFNEKTPEYVNDYYSQSKSHYNNIIGAENSIFIEHIND